MFGVASTRAKGREQPNSNAKRLDGGGRKIKRFRWKQYIEFPGVSSRACCSDISLFRVATYPTGDGTKAREGGRKPNINLAANQKGNSNIVTECNSDFLSSMGSREWREMPLCPGQD